jgi:hypothetical protein
MRDSDQDIVRRALSSVLGRLEQGARAESEITAGANADQSTKDRHTQPRMNGDAARDDSIIVIFLGQPGEASKEMREDPATGNVEKRSAFDRRGMQAAHPGLEKFSIAGSETAPSAPKTCFMEPGRVCVNSGACEMRGY